MLARYPVVVSSRLHTCVLGLAAGAPVVPVETGTFKLTGFFEQLGDPTRPVRMGEEGWQDELLTRVDKVRSSPEARIAEQDVFVAAARSHWTKSLESAFSEDLPRW
jgi:polysaccharide pyruvyl transferase WcaK-like protein